MITNAPEIRKLSTLSVFWLTLIFSIVWGVCWLVGVVLPYIITGPLSNWFGGASIAPAIGQTLQALVPIVAILVFIPINAMFMVLLERRALAIFTVRMGPNRVGPDGYLQTAADAVKLLFKEDITPRGADAAMFTLAPIVFFAPSVFGAIPLLAPVSHNHDLFAICNLPTGIFFVLAAASIPVVGIVMGGWASNNKYSLVGGLRSAAQAISYEIPLVLALVTVCVVSGTLDVLKIAEQQSGGAFTGVSELVLVRTPDGGAAQTTIPVVIPNGGIFDWNVCGLGSWTGIGKYIQAVATHDVDGTIRGTVLSTKKEPGKCQADDILRFYYPDGIWSAAGLVVLTFSGIMLFLLYLTGACAEINRIPFDLPEAESELVSGYNTEYSGIKFAIFFLAEFTNLFIVSTIAVVMFLGGGSNPLPDWVVKPIIDFGTNNLTFLTDFLYKQIHILNPITFFAVFWGVAKTYSIVFFAILVRGTLPRFRIDQLMGFGWKRLIPLAFIVFMLVIIFREFVHCHA